MKVFTKLLLGVAVFLACSDKGRAEAVDAKWIWLDEGNPLESAPAGKVWFRREVRATEPSTGEIRIASDDPFSLWINGRHVADGKGGQGYRFNLNGIVDRGTNAIAVLVDNADGKAGLLVDGEVRSQGGTNIPFDSGPEWVATRTAPEGDGWIHPRFDAAGWQRVKVLAPHADSPWKEISFGDSYLDRFQLAEGFSLVRIGEPELVGSLIAFTWGNRGRLIASRERGPILALVDENGDGIYDKAEEYSDKVKSCQGLCMVQDDLYAVGEGPDGAGLYRLPDRNHDDKADSVELLYKYKGGVGEHGPHNVVLGPDGWLYNNLGNHSWVTSTPEPTTPVRGLVEGDLLQPRFEDAHGHAAGIKVPGGTIWRFSPDGKKWWLTTAGFRNHYDIAFNSDGELFTFDSDMEWDVGAPWYRPIRVNLCIPGSEFGWRSGTANGPAYYFDSLPGTVDVGRGSPTGVVFYEHRQFPKRYQGAFLVSDWSMGRIIAVRLEPAGASYTGTWENLVVGNPLNVSDIEVDRDGSVVFSTGGRGTEGGLYRVSHRPSTVETQAVASETLEDVFSLPQMTSHWAREAASAVKSKTGSAWDTGLVERARTGTAAEQIRALTLMAQLGPKPTEDLLRELASAEDPSVRAFVALLLGDHPSPAVAEVLTRMLGDADSRVQRRACEAFVRSGLVPPVDPLIGMFSKPDRWLRFAARVALERVPPQQWRMRVLESKDPMVVLHGLLALQRLGSDVLPGEIILEKELALLSNWRSLNPEQLMDAIRMAQLTLAGGASGPTASAIGQVVNEIFPSGQPALDMETARILAHLQVPGAIDKILAHMEAEQDQSRQIHYSLVLYYIKDGWDITQKGRLLDWYEKTRDWEGGHSFVPFLENIVGGSVDRYDPKTRRELLERWAERPYATRMLFKRSNATLIEDYDGLIARILAGITERPELDKYNELVEMAVNALSGSASPRAQELLRGLFESQPDKRDQIARILAVRPSEENFPYLVRALNTDDPSTLQAVVKALLKIDTKPEQADILRSAIVAALRLDKKQRPAAAALLEKWTEADPIAYYQNWFKEKYPDQPAPELAQAPAKSKYTYDQLYDYLEKDPRGKEGDVERGRAVFAKANCVKCHQFLKEGQGIGPDLTSVRRRFQRKEIIDSLVYPSKIISDQYKSVTLVMTDGSVHTGLLAKQAGSDKLVLWQSNATKLELSAADVEEQSPSPISVMPEGILDDLTLDEIADLFAFLETSKLNAPATATASAGAAPTGGQ